MSRKATKKLPRDRGDRPPREKATASAADIPRDPGALGVPVGRRPGIPTQYFDWKVWLTGAAIVAVIFLAYQPCWHGGFLLDDDIHLLNNPVLRPGGLARIWVPGGYINYWPLTFSVYGIEYRLWGLAPLGFHLVNVGLHALAALLVWRMLARLEAPGAMLAAAIFALHPVNVESVAWISQLKGILSLVFALVSMLMFLDFERRGSGWRYGISIVAFLLSTLAKGMAITLPIVLLACAWWQRGRIERRDVLRVVPFLLIGALMAGVEIWSQRFMAGQGVVRTDGILGRAAVAGCALWFYLGKLVLPIHLSPIYPLWTIRESSLISYLPAALWIVLLIWAWRRRRTWGRPIVMLIVCYTALLLPALGFVNITFMQFSLVADHWQYIAMIVPCAVFAGLMAILARRFMGPTSSMAAAVGLLLVLGITSWGQCRSYRDAIPFYETAVAQSPECLLAQNNLGNALAHHGRFEEAVAHLEKALAINPDFAETHTNLAAALADHGQLDSAIAHYRKALSIKPDLAEAHHNLALALDRQGQFDAALAHFQKAAELKPGLAAIHSNFAAALADHGQLDLAIAQYKMALRINPDDVAIQDKLQSVLAEWSRLLKNIDRLHAELQSRPNDPALLNEVAWTLATNPNSSIRNGAAATALAKRSLRLSGGDDPNVLATLAAAYAEIGQFSDAIETAENAERKAIAAGDRALVKRIQNCNALYRSDKPYRQLSSPNVGRGPSR